MHTTTEPTFATSIYKTKEELRLLLCPALSKRMFNTIITFYGVRLQLKVHVFSLYTIEEMRNAVLTFTGDCKTLGGRRWVHTPTNTLFYTQCP